MSEQLVTLERVKEAYEASFDDINGRKYEITKTPHRDRQVVFAFYSEIQKKCGGGFEFLSWPTYPAIERILCDRLTFEGVQISKRKNHWDDYPEDFLQFVQIAMGVISYPFVRGGHGG
ncbi:MAG: hypothetical protein IBX55_08850 [Methyloprofundus sp.]|nr:hypothetical protein [Methyloprofundus sp.]